ncbi:MAG: signal peptide peptidase SppA [Phycisphaerales bacterium]
MRSRYKVIWSVTLLCIALTLTSCMPTRFVVDTGVPPEKLTETVVIPGPSRSRIAIIDLTGLIYDADAPGLLGPGENPSSRFVESLRVAGRDGRVKAVIIRLNSPGGTVTASDMLYREVLRFKETTRKPVVMLMADLAASGAFYIACAGDEVIAAPTTITGSIGVIMQTVNFSEGMRKIGISADAVTSGPNKAMGSPFQPMSSEHRALMQGMVDEFYVRFHDIVAARRPELSVDDLAWTTDGRVVSGARAADIGLIDATGDLYDAVNAAKRLANLEAAEVIKYHRPLEYVGSAYASTPITSQVNMVNINLHGSLPLLPPPPGFYYLWHPGGS